ncbi:MAG TPA: cytidylate kinase family protein [Candidatus Nitrosocosmicus sp.]|nr:cytidylate kinase family protein [Candidatus Nitrosocosmicus sp.]
MHLNYNNITISGGVGVGTSTLSNNLKTYLLPLGWTFFSGGEFMRSYAIENGLFSAETKGHHNAETYSDEFDKQVDFGMKETLENKKNQVLEAWLAGFFARDLPDTLRILLTCSNKSIRIDRVVNRDNVSIEEAKASIKDREETNILKWKRLYGDYNFFDPQYYHLVIDTYAIGPLETTGMVLDTLGYDHSKIKIDRK